MKKLLLSTIALVAICAMPGVVGLVFLLLVFFVLIKGAMKTKL